MTAALTTGLPGLDRILKGLLPGDNIVWQVASIDHYRPFVKPVCEAALAAGKAVVYFRFGRHEPLLDPAPGIEIHPLDPEEGFERFIGEIHRVLDEVRDRGVYLFDCLSDLAADWCSDRMLANFFRLTCPYVYEVAGLAYFAILKDCHSPQAISLIADTTQILIDVYRDESRLYIHPIKVQQRHSSTMYTLHAWEGDVFQPVSESATIARVLTAKPFAGASVSRPRLGVWTKAFLEAEEFLETRPPARGESEPELKRRLLRMLISRDERMLALAEEYFTLSDPLQVWKRTIGTGLIGGKAVGMLVARAILRAASPRWQNLLEEHDSFYVGSDVFYSYLVQNGCWWIRAKQRDPARFLEGAEEGRRRILTGTFSPEIQQEFAAMLDYFGQCPIIVRSSSLLEDAYGNSFAGKYESVFCANQGPPGKRLEDFMTAVRTVYASTMSERALRYRAHRGMLDRDEQMSLLVQRVSGAMHGSLFFPHAAGVALSYNPYVWNERIDPKAGVLRVVLGLGTRAVDRNDDDYTRVVALNAPQLRPEAGLDQVRRYTQRKVDTLDLAANQLVSRDFVDVLAECPTLPIETFASRDDELERLSEASGGGKHWLLTFDRLLSETSFVSDMRELLKTLSDAYGCQVDTEFTANFFEREGYRLNLLQCRPLQVHAEAGIQELSDRVGGENLIFEARGVVVGQSRVISPERIIYVVPEDFGKLPIRDRYQIARIIGHLIHLSGPTSIVLLGPGRWGTTTPSLGVPVSYAEISRASVVCEIVAMREGLVPEVSLGTHFFNELVEANILYLALFPGRSDNHLGASFFEAMPNRLAELLPDAAGWSHVLRVIDAADLSAGRAMKLHADNVHQRVVCYLQNSGK